VIDIDVAVQRRRDFALNRHLYIPSVMSSMVLDKPYRDKSWHTLNKFLATFFLIIIV